MTKLRGEVRVAMLIALPLVGLAALFVRSQAVAHMDVAAARDAVLAALASLARADAPAPTPTPPVGATVGDPDAKLMDAVATAYITALQKQDYKSAWELVHPDARGKWTLETWRDLRESMRGMPDGGRNGADDTIALLMGRDTTLQEIATRGMVGMAHVTVNVDAPARIALRRTGKGEWAVDLAATDDIEAHRKIAAQLADLRDTGSAQTFARAILMADDRSVPGALVDCALLGGEGVKLEISDRHAEGDHAAMTVRGSGTLHLAVPLANGERGWSIAWCRGVTPFPPGKTVAQLMDEEEGYRERGTSAKGGPPGSMKGAPGGDEMYTCRANMRQISMALLMYTADHDQRFPPANKWHSAALPYCKDEAFFACPTDPTKEPKTSYALNYKLSKLPMTSVMYPNLTIPNILTTNNYIHNTTISLTKCHFAMLYQCLIQSFQTCHIMTICSIFPKPIQKLFHSFILS